MQDHLILRSATSPYPNDLTKGSVLSHAELDGNLIFLEGKLIYTATTSGNTITLVKLNGETILLNTVDIYVTGGTVSNSGTTATFTNNTGGTFSVTGFAAGLWTTGSTGSYSLKTINDSGLDATGNYALSEGFETLASGDKSHAEGDTTIASGTTSHAEGNGTIAGGNYSHAEGDRTIASGARSHAEGIFSEASGDKSHAENDRTQAIGDSSHAEGSQTIASGNNSHSEGDRTNAIGTTSHAEGLLSVADGNYSHAEGESTNAIGVASHAEGNGTIASGTTSHAEGNSTIAIGNYSHAEGNNTIATGTSSHSEGVLTIASGTGSHAEGFGGEASGSYSHAEGDRTISSGLNSHAEGALTQATGEAAHAQGQTTIASGDKSHAEGESTQASGESSHAEGDRTISSGLNSHAEGALTQATGEAAHAQGQTTIASGDKSHAEGESTQASGESSHAEGLQTIALGTNSHTEGSHTESNGENSHAGGFKSIAEGEDSFIHSHNSIVLGNRSIVLGGSNITGSTDDTVYVPYLNIRNLNIGAAIVNLGIDVDGNVVSGSTPFDVFVTGGTYSGGNALFTNNTGGTFSVSGFTSGLTDTRIASYTYNNTNNTTTIVDTTGGTFSTVITRMSGLTITNELDATTISATTYLGLPIDVYVTGGTLSSGGTATFVNNTGGTFSISGFSTGGTGSGLSRYALTTGFTSGVTITVPHNLNTLDVVVQVKDLTSNALIGVTIDDYQLNSIDVTTSIDIASARIIILGAGAATGSSGFDVYVTGGTLSTGTITFTNNTGGTFTVTGFTDGLWEVGTGSGSLQTAGNGADASGLDSIAIGLSAIATGTTSMAIGAGAEALADSANAFGDGASVDGANSTAIGSNAFVQGINSTAIGNSASVISANTITLGNVSVTATTFNGSLMPFYNSAEQPGRVGEFLTSQGAGVAPKWTSSIYVTGGTYSSGTTTFTNVTGGTFTVTGLTTGAINLGSENIFVSKDGNDSTGTNQDISKAFKTISGATAKAVNLTPSATNIINIIVLPGTYIEDVTINTSFINIITFTPNELIYNGNTNATIITASAGAKRPVYINGLLKIGVDNVNIVGVNCDNFAVNSISTNSNFSNMVVGTAITTTASTLNGVFYDIHCPAFLTITAATTLSGFYQYCTAQGNSFASSTTIAGGNISGRMNDCIATSNSFASTTALNVNGGNITGTLTNCRCSSSGNFSSNNIFPSSGNGGTISGTLINCNGGTGSNFGFSNSGTGGVLSGKFFNCIGGTTTGNFGSCFIGTGGTLSGEFYNCVGGTTGNFGSTTGSNSLGGTQGGTLSGKFMSCVSAGNSFASVTTGSSGTATAGTISGTMNGCISTGTFSFASSPSIGGTIGTNATLIGCIGAGSDFATGGFAGGTINGKLTNCNSSGHAFASSIYTSGGTISGTLISCRALTNVIGILSCRCFASGEINGGTISGFLTNCESAGTAFASAFVGTGGTITSSAILKGCIAGGIDGDTGATIYTFASGGADGGLINGLLIDCHDFNSGNDAEHSFAGGNINRGTMAGTLKSCSTKKVVGLYRTTVTGKVIDCSIQSTETNIPAMYLGNGAKVVRCEVKGHSGASYSIDGDAAITVDIRHCDLFGKGYNSSNLSLATGSPYNTDDVNSLF